MKKLLVLAGVLLIMGINASNAQELRIGFLTTLTGGGAVLGEEMQRGLNLALEHRGWTENGDELGGVPTTIFIGDDQQNPEAGLTVVNRWLREERVQIVAGIVWSHVLMAVRNQVVNSRSILMSTNAGPAPIAGEQCSKYFISTSYQNDQNGEAPGALLTDDGIERVYLMAPNYQAGKDLLAGVRRTYEGEVIGQALFPVGASDYQSEIARVRDADPDALAIFAPGGMGISFMRQWAASGLADQIPIYTIIVVDWTTLGAIGEDAVGSIHTNWWRPDSDEPQIERFVNAFVAKHGRPPSMYAAQTYEAINLIATSVEAVDGNVDDTLNLMRQMRKAEFDSLRGDFRFNVNGVPIQDWYRREVVMSPEGPTIRTTGVIFSQRGDSYADQCPEREHLR